MEDVPVSSGRDLPLDARPFQSLICTAVFVFFFGYVLHVVLAQDGVRHLMRVRV